MLKRQLEKIWDQLRVKKSQLQYYLDDVRIQNLRGIRDIKVSFSYPVTVLAGPNACGKSTILYATACLYDGQTDEQGTRRYPSDLFPGFHSTQQGVPSDQRTETVLEYSYMQEGERLQMRWRRGEKGKWNKSFFGRKKVDQPKRAVYIRTLASLTNPGEVRSILQLGRHEVKPQTLSAALLAFAHRILPTRYATITSLGISRKELLFAELEDKTKYSEFHMASGERAILRLSRDISELRDALILIDEVDVGLHPFTQQQLMLELQRLALRQNLQIIVTTHSPIVIDSVPPEGRIFLERTEDNVVLRETFRDILQRAMYGRPLERLNVLCEDRIGKAIVQGVMDELGPELALSSGDLDVGHDTGKDEYAQHVRTLARFHQLDSFIFVLDGDARDVEGAVRAAAQEAGQTARLLFLPGNECPEQWAWNCLLKHCEKYSDRLGTSCDVLQKEMTHLERSFEATTDKASEVAKNRLYVLVEGLGRDMEEVCRIVAREEASSVDGSLIEFKNNLHDAIRDWRSS